MARRTAADAASTRPPTRPAAAVAKPARLRLRERARAWFDRTMDRGTPALIGWLGFASLVLISVITGLVLLLDGPDAARGWPEIAWESLLRTLDPGTMGGDQGVVFRVLMLLVTIGGIFIVSSLIGVLTTGMDSRIAELRKGRSRVVERGHAVILGWSDQVFTVISELVRANQGGRSSVVVLADHDKVDMEDQIRARVGDTGRVRVVCRSGSPLKRTDLDLVAPDSARSITVLSPAGPDPDIDVIKALLLLNHRPWGPDRPHVVAAVQVSENLAAARLAAGPHAQIIDADDIAVRLVVQSHRQSGLSTVCTDLLNFAGSEIYMRAEPELTGRTYGEALHAYELGCPIGLLRADDVIALNPPMATPIEATDRMIVVAEDDLLVRLATRPAPVIEEAIAPDEPPPGAPEHTLIIGWNERAPKIIELLDRQVPGDSVVDVAAPTRPADLDTPRLHLRMSYKPCETTSRQALEKLEPGAYTTVVVLADDSVEPARADDRTLVTLLHLRDIEESLGDPFSIITEMNDDSNREVAQVTKADDFIVSSKLISLLMTQMAENRHLHRVFAELFDPSGAEVHLRPARYYLRPGVAANFATVIEAARRRGETAIGYRITARGDQAPDFGVTLNPRKSAALALGERDTVIVIAEN